MEFRRKYFFLPPPGIFSQIFNIIQRFNIRIIDIKTLASPLHYQQQLNIDDIKYISHFLIMIDNFGNAEIKSNRICINV